MTIIEELLVKSEVGCMPANVRKVAKNDGELASRPPPPFPGLLSLLPLLLAQVQPLPPDIPPSRPPSRSRSLSSWEC